MILSFRRAACLAAAALLCLSVLGGCAGDGQPTSAPGQPAASGTTGAAPADSPLNDGRLRVFQNSVLFRGSECLLTAPASGSVWLLEDSTDESSVYAVLAQPQGSDAYVYSVLDASGSTVFDCGTQQPRSLHGGWMLLVPGEQDTGTDGTARLVKLETGEVRQAPAGASYFFAAGDHYVLNCETAFDPDGLYHCDVVVLDSTMQESARFTDSFANSSPEDGSPWVAVYPLYSDGTASGGAWLYNAQTGERVGYDTGSFSSFCSGSIAQMRPEGENGPYRLLDLNTGETLAEYDAQCDLYLGGAALLWNIDGSDFNYLLCRADGSTVPAYTFDQSAGRVLVLLADSVECYDETGALIFSQPLDASALAYEGDWVSYSITDLGGTQFLLSVYSGESRCTIYGPDGPVVDLAGYDGVYHPEGTSYLLASRQGQGSVWLCDVLAMDGTPLVTGVVQSYGTLIGDVVPVRRGFAEGWIDLSGNWLWQRSIWQSANDEGTAYFYG